MPFPHPRLAALFLVSVLVVPAYADKLDDDLAAAKGLLLAGNADAASDKLDALSADARKALDGKPDDAHANYILGMAAMYGGVDSVATRALDLAGRLEPKNATFAFGRAELASYQNKPAEAIGILQRFLQQDPKNVEAWARLGATDVEARQYAPARESFQKAADLAPREPKYVVRIAETWVAEGKEDQAVAAYEKVLLLDPRNAAALSSLGEVERRRNHLARALDLFSQAVASDPADYRSLARQVQIYQAAGRTKERDAVLEKIRALHATGKADFATFCREQLRRDEETVMAFEYFPAKGKDFATLYAFIVLGSDGKEIKQRLQLAASGESTETPIWRLLADTEKESRLLKTFPAVPTYEETRRAVLDFLDGKLTPSETGPAGGGR